MSWRSKAKKFAWQFFKIDDPVTLRDDYIDKTIDRERKLRQLSKWDRVNFLNAFNWYPSHYSAYEKRFLLKVDICVFLFLGASFFTKFLDNVNVGTAYVSGLKEDLDLHGNELNIFNTCYSVGYAVFQVPLTLLLTKHQFSRHLLLFCELAYGMMTLANAYVKTARQMYAVRFFVGVFEACSTPAAFVIMSSFFTEEELYQRAGLYGAFGTSGSASSGALQSKAREKLDGVAGLRGWQWQFIIDAVITFGIFLYGFFLFPGTPNSCKKFSLFSEDDMTFARNRLKHCVAIPQKFTWKTIKETLLTWQIYFATILWSLYSQCWYNNSPLLYMKSRPEHFTTTMVTNWNSYIHAVGVPMDILLSPIVQYYGMFIPVNFVFGVGYYCAIILVIWNVSQPLIMSAFFLTMMYKAALSQVLTAWFAVLCKDNVEKKAITIAWAQAFSYAVNAFGFPLQYNMKDSPRFKKGYIANLILIIATHIVFLFGMWMDKYDLKYFPKISGNRHTEYNGDEISCNESKVVSITEIDVEKDDMSIDVPDNLGSMNDSKTSF